MSQLPPCLITKRETKFVVARLKKKFIILVIMFLYGNYDWRPENKSCIVEENPKAGWLFDRTNVVLVDYWTTNDTLKWSLLYMQREVLVISNNIEVETHTKRRYPKVVPCTYAALECWQSYRNFYNYEVSEISSSTLSGYVWFY